jgi:hypothetical protein
MPKQWLFLPILALAVGVLGGCSGGDDSPRRTVTIEIQDDACTPGTIQVGKGESVTIAGVNKGKKDTELEGINGMKFEEVLVPSGKTRSAGWTAPNKTGSAELKCYVPTGQSTIVKLEILDSLPPSR